LFTGLVQDLGSVVGLMGADGGARLTVQTSLRDDIREGDSVMVNGVCLTAVGLEDGRFSADLSSETLERSALGDLSAGEQVNLELSLRPSDRLGGHIVQGHVDGVGTVESSRLDGSGRNVSFRAPADLGRYIVEKGSIAVDGVSLTVAGLDGDVFEAVLIPETLDRTNLTQAEPGRRVNLEVDVIAKYVERLVNRG
jgi:riboflavin synthase